MASEGGDTEAAASSAAASGDETGAAATDRGAPAAETGAADTGAAGAPDAAAPPAPPPRRDSLPQTLSLKVDEGPLGLSLDASLVVARVGEESAAAHSGVRPGMRLVAVNGKPLGDAPPAEGLEAVKAAGRPIDLTFTAPQQARRVNKLEQDLTKLEGFLSRTVAAPTQKLFKKGVTISKKAHRYSQPLLSEVGTGLASAAKVVDSGGRTLIKGLDTSAAELRKAGKRFSVSVRQTASAAGSSSSSSASAAKLAAGLSPELAAAGTRYCEGVDRKLANVRDSNRTLIARAEVADRAIDEAHSRVTNTHNEWVALGHTLTNQVPAIQHDLEDVKAKATSAVALLGEVSEKLAKRREELGQQKDELWMAQQRHQVEAHKVQSLKQLKGVEQRVAARRERQQKLAAAEAANQQRRESAVGSALADGEAAGGDSAAADTEAPAVEAEGAPAAAAPAAGNVVGGEDDESEEEEDDDEPGASPTEAPIEDAAELAKKRRGTVASLVQKVEGKAQDGGGKEAGTADGAGDGADAARDGAGPTDEAAQDHGTSKGKGNSGGGGGGGGGKGKGKKKGKGKSKR